MRILALAVALAAVQQAPVFKTGVDYVSVDVIVTDRNDVPVTDLTKEDFEIIDRGKPQVITSFEYVDMPVATRTVDLKAPRPPEPDVATNLPSSADSRLFVMVIDDLHIVESEIVGVKKIMTDFIAALSPDDEVAVVYVGRSDLSQNFTKDVGRLLRAVDKVRDALGFGLDALAHTPTPEPQPTKTALNYARSAAQVLKNVATSLAGSGHSRRAIVFVSSGTTLDPRLKTNPVELKLVPIELLHDDLEAAYEAARRGNVPIYTLDPRGQVLPDDAVRGGMSGVASLDVRSRIRENIKRQQDNLAEIAINTGGRAFLNHSDLTRAVREIVRDNGSYYLLGFYPNPSDRDGKFHEIDVKVKRPGLRVRPRAGYVAPKPAPETSDTKPAMDAAISAGVNVSGLSLQAIVSPLAPVAAGMRSAVTIEVTYPVPESSRRISDDLRIRVIALDPDGKVKTSVEQNRAFTGMAPDGQAVVKFVIDDAVDLPSQGLTLRIGVASRALGKTGTVQLPIEVPRADGRLAISGLALTSDDQPPIGVMSKELIADLVPFQPVLTRSFAISDTIRVFGRLFWEGRDESAAVTVALAGARRELQAPPLTLAGVVTAGNRRQAELDTTLRLAELAPGDYVLRISAKLGNGQTAMREVPLTLR
jgi:VWFA-related protein